MEIELFAVILLFILLYAYKKNKTDNFQKDQLLFEKMNCVNIVILLFDCGACIFNGRSSSASSSFRPSSSARCN